MNRLLCAALVCSLIPAHAQPNKKTDAGKKKTQRPVEVARDQHHRVLQVRQNTRRLTKNWVFVVDSSHSTWQIAARILAGFRTATLMPTDELKFATYVFNNKGCHHFRNWKDASVEEFNKTERFVRNKRGVNSYAAKALEEALRQPKKDLTVILISDGGFSDGQGRAGSASNQAVIKKVIDDNQQWRINNGYGRAVITAIGIENFMCWPRYPKSTNGECMRGMRDIGVNGEGGFFYVQELPRIRRSNARKSSTPNKAAHLNLMTPK